MRDSDHSDADIRALGFDLLREEGYDEKFQGIECLAKTIKSFSADDLHTLERSLVLHVSRLAIIDKYVFDWATSDNLSSHVITKAMLNNKDCIQVRDGHDVSPPDCALMERCALLEAALCLRVHAAFCSPRHVHRDDPRHL